MLVTDLTARRIPNFFSIGGALLALAFFAATGESVLGASWQSMLLGAGLALVLTLPGYLAHGLGAGDVKFLLAIGLLGGWHTVLVCFIVAGLLGGAAALSRLVLARHTGYPTPAGKWLPFGAALSLGLLVAIGLKA